MAQTRPMPSVTSSEESFVDAQLKPPSAQHWFEEHTGEVELHLAASTLEQLFVEAGLGLADLLSDQRRPPDGAPESVEAADGDALLVDWLNELIFRTETRQKVYDEIRINSLSDRRLRADIRGAAPDGWRTAVKAATYHRLRIAREAAGYTGRVVLDV